MSKKILHVIVSMNPADGGVAQAVRLIVRGLQEIGIESEIISLDTPGEKFLGEIPYTIHSLGPRKGPWSYANKLQPFLVKNLQRFDAVILHGLWQYPGYAVKSAFDAYSKLNKTSSNRHAPSFLIMPHGMLDPYFQKAKDRRLKAIRNLIFWKFVEKGVIRDADNILFTCEEEMLLARTTFTQYKPAKETVVSLGIPPTIILEESNTAFFKKCPAAVDQKYLLYMGRIHIKKGVDMLLKAYQEILDRKRATNADSATNLPKLLLAGPGWETDYGKQVFAAAQKSEKLNSCVIFTGMLNHTEKWGALNNCEAFILPSHQENFGIAIVEALSCGKPVLISNKVNIWREIQAGHGGMVNDDTVQGTLGNIRDWISKTELEKLKMSAAAQATFEQYFSLKTATQKMSKALNDSKPKK